MKKILFLMMAIIAINVSAKDIKELIVTTTPPMSCQNCENKIKGNLRFEKGIKKIETNIPDQRVTIEYDADKTTPQKIEEAFQKFGYKVEVINDNKAAKKHASSESSECDGSCKKDSKAS